MISVIWIKLHIQERSLYKVDYGMWIKYLL